MIIQIILITLLLTFATILSAIAGFGTSTISIPLLTLFFPLHQVIFFIAIIHWFENIWRLIFFKSRFRLKTILQFAIPAIVFAVIGARIGIKIQEEILIKILGCFLLLYAIFLFIQPKYQMPRKLTTLFTGGLLSGFFAGIIGIGGAIRSAFLHSLNLPKISYIFVVSAISFFIDTARIPVYFTNGTSLETFFIWSAIIFIPCSCIATYFAKKIVLKIPQHYFRIIVTIFLGLAGLKFLIWS